MKLLNKLAIGATAFLAACTAPAPTSYTVTGILPDSSLNGKEVVMRPTMAQEIVASTTVNGNKFVLEGVADSAMIAMIYIKDTPKFGLLILENGNITLDLTTADKGAAYADGTENNKTMREILAVCDTIAKENVKTESAKWFAKHNNDIMGAFLFTSPLFHALDDETKLATAENFGEYLKNLEFVQEKIKVLKGKIATAPSKQFVDFSGTDVEGKVVKLSDYVGKGNYVVVDMWASWCGPCKREIPNLAEVHNLYKEKGLTVLGIFVWDDVKNLQPSMKAEGITWPQIIDSEKCATAPYGVDGIPAIMLFGPDGTILERGSSMRGENMKNTVEKYLPKK